MMQPLDAATKFPEFYIVVGPMYSGKTRKLQEIMYRNAAADGDGLVINHVNDEIRQAVEESAGGGEVSRGEPAVEKKEDGVGAHAGHARSHDGKRCAAVFVRCLMSDVLPLPEYAAANWVAVDEAQFFDPKDLGMFVSRARYFDRKNLVVVGLHADDHGDHFMDFNNLIPHCTSFKMLSARCQVPGCLAMAHHTHAAFDKRDKVDCCHASEYHAMCDLHFLQAKLYGMAGTTVDSKLIDTHTWKSK